MKHTTKLRDECRANGSKEVVGGMGGEYHAGGLKRGPRVCHRVGQPKPDEFLSFQTPSAACLGSDALLFVMLPVVYSHSVSVLEKRYVPIAFNVHKVLLP